MEITKVGIESIAIIQHIAKITWAIAYKEIISNDQLDYMLDKMYSTRSLQNQIQVQGHQFILANFENNPVGFAAYHNKASIPEKMIKLHKIYVDPSQQSKGVGKSMLQFIINEMKFYLETASLAEFSARFDADLALGISGLGGAGTANDTGIA